MKTTRRRFIHTLASTAISTSALPLLTDSPSADTTLNVALLGLGNYATRVADALKDCKNAKLVGLISGTPTKLDSWVKKYNLDPKNTYNYQNLDTILTNPAINAVYVTTPNALHKPFALRVAKAGKHVISEKPMGASAADAREMISACQQAGVRLMVGYRLHFEPYTRELIRIRESGEMGKIMHVIATNGFKIGDPTQWRLKKELAGGGALMDMGIYCVNGARYATGEEPIWITAQEVKTNPQKFMPGVDETVSFQMGFPSGVIASCTTSYNFNSLDRLTAVGERGFVELSPAFGYGPTHGRTNKGELTQPNITHQTLQMDGMADLILNKKTISPSVDGEEGLRDMVILEAIYEAIRTGQRVNLKA